MDEREQMIRHLMGLDKGISRRQAIGIIEFHDALKSAWLRLAEKPDRPPYTKEDQDRDLKRLRELWGPEWPSHAKSTYESYTRNKDD